MLAMLEFVKKLYVSNPDTRKNILQLAFQEANFDVLKITLEAGATVNELCANFFNNFDFEKPNPKSLEFINFFKDNGLDMVTFRCDRSNNTLLHWFAVKGNLEIFKFIYDACPSLLNVPNDLGQTPFMIAAREGHEVLVKYLLTQPVNLEAVSKSFILDSNNKTALIYALSHRQLAIVDLLIEFGALISIEQIIDIRYLVQPEYDQFKEEYINAIKKAANKQKPDFKANLNKTLHKCIQTQSWHIANCLCKIGATISDDELRKKLIKEILSIQQEEQYKSVAITFLMNNKIIQINTNNNNDNELLTNFLYDAIGKLHLTLADNLLKNGTVISEKQGVDLLFDAVGKNQAPIVKFLFANNILDIKKHGNTALKAASLNTSSYTALALIEAGADINAYPDNLLLLHFAVSSSLMETAEKLILADCRLSYKSQFSVMNPVGGNIVKEFFRYNSYNDKSNAYLVIGFLNHYLFEIAKPKTINITILGYTPDIKSSAATKFITYLKECIKSDNTDKLECKLTEDEYKALTINGDLKKIYKFFTEHCPKSLVLGIINSGVKAVVPALSTTTTTSTSTSTTTTTTTTTTTNTVVATPTSTTTTTNIAITSPTQTATTKDDDKNVELLDMTSSSSFKSLGTG